MGTVYIFLSRAGPACVTAKDSAAANALPPRSPPPRLGARRSRYSSDARPPYVSLPPGPPGTAMDATAFFRRKPRSPSATAWPPAHGDLQYIRQSISGRRAPPPARPASSVAASLCFDDGTDLLHRLVMLDNGPTVRPERRDLGLQPAQIALGLLGRLRSASLRLRGFACTKFPAPAHDPTLGRDLTRSRKAATKMDPGSSPA